jgi:hypothetical protein
MKVVNASYKSIPYILTPWSQVDQEILILYETQKFTILLRVAHHWSIW